MDEVKIIELPQTSTVGQSDKVLIETDDGTKVASILSLKALIDEASTFETLEDLRYAQLERGLIYSTLGYRKKYDGGGARYQIVYDPTLKPNGADVIKLHTSDTLRAVMVINSGSVTPEQFGARGDGKGDDSTAIQSCIDSGMSVVFKSGATYRIKSPIKIKSDTCLDFNGSTILTDLCTGIVVDDVDISDIDYLLNHKISVKLSNFTINANSGGYAIDLEDIILSNLVIENFKIITRTDGIRFSLADHVTIRDGKFETTRTSTTNAIRNYLRGIMADNLSEDVKFATNITISNIVLKNIDILLRSDKSHEGYTLDNVRIYDIYYYGASKTNAFSCIARLMSGYYNMTITRVYARYMNSLVELEEKHDTGTKGFCNISNVQGHHLNSILDASCEYDIHTMKFNVVNSTIDYSVGEP